MNYQQAIMAAGFPKREPKAERILTHTLQRLGLERPALLLDEIPAPQNLLLPQKFGPIPEGFSLGKIVSLLGFTPNLEEGIETILQNLLNGGIAPFVKSTRQVLEQNLGWIIWASSAFGQAAEDPIYQMWKVPANAVYSFRPTAVTVYYEERQPDGSIVLKPKLFSSMP